MIRELSDAKFMVTYFSSRRRGKQASYWRREVARLKKLMNIAKLNNGDDQTCSTK